MDWYLLKYRRLMCIDNNLVHFSCTAEHVTGTKYFYPICLFSLSMSFVDLNRFTNECAQCRYIILVANDSLLSPINVAK